MATWEEIKSSWKELDDNLKKEKYGIGEFGLVLDFNMQIKNTVNQLEAIEKKIEAEGINSPDPAIRDSFKSFLGILHSIVYYPIGGHVMTVAAKEGLQKIWNFAILAITSFLERRAEAVGAENWSLAASIGFPMGVSGTVSVTFRTALKTMTSTQVTQNER